VKVVCAWRGLEIGAGDSYWSSGGSDRWCKPVMVGASKLPTVKLLLLVAEPAGAVTAMGPVVAPAGTVEIIVVAVAETIAAVNPLNATVF